MVVVFGHLNTSPHQLLIMTCHTQQEREALQTSPASTCPLSATGVNISQFYGFAQDMVGRFPHIGSLQLQPQAVVTWAWPTTGAVGHDLLNDPKRRQVHCLVRPWEMGRAEHFRATVSASDNHRLRTYPSDESR